MSTGNDYAQLFWPATVSLATDAAGPLVILQAKADRRFHRFKDPELALQFYERMIGRRLRPVKRAAYVRMALARQQ